ncbi:MAG: hypothetical protein ACOX85_09985, partial [Candidatus Pararuminococcus gallinarum]
PRTYKGKNRCVLWKKHALINSRERPLKSDINLEQSSHVETVVLLGRKKADGEESSPPHETAGETVVHLPR